MTSNRVLGGRYRFERLLGSGGMSDVWLAEDEHLGRWVAVKLAHAPGPADRTEQFQRVFLEAHATANLQHPNIVATFDAGIEDGAPYLVMEYVHGYSVRELVEGWGHLSEVDAVRYGMQAAAALEYAHRRGVTHCDVKPENMLVTQDGVLKVADFGVSSRVTAALGFSPGGVYGSREYIAPEILRGEPCTPASDVYSLALSIHEMATGTLPGNEGGAGLSDRLREALARASASDPAARPQSAEAFRRMLAASLEASPGRRDVPARARARRRPDIEAFRRNLPRSPEGPRDADRGWSGLAIVVAVGGALMLSFAAGALTALAVAR